MPERTKQQSNPFSTGGGGINFETRIQAAFTLLMLTGRIAPCLPPYPITKIELQGKYAGFDTDDLIVFTKHTDTGKQAKLLAQIKHAISITAGNQVFADVIQSAWLDFNNTQFDLDTDAIALITGPLSTTDVNHVRPLLEWARHCSSSSEFITKINTSKFGSIEKRKKLDVFRAHLKNASDGKDFTEQQLWSFLKSFYLIGYDLDTASGSTLSILQSLMTSYSDISPAAIWGYIVSAITSANQNAGTLTIATLPTELTTIFDTPTFNNWHANLRKLADHSDYILAGIRTSIGDIHIRQPELIAQLVELSQTSDFVLVTGQRGVGKSSLVRSFCNHISARNTILCLRTEDFNRPHLDGVFSSIGLTGSLADTESGLALLPKKYLLLESLEKLLELENTAAFIDLLHLVNKQHGWTIIATCRDYAYQSVTFNFLQPYGTRFSWLKLDGFSQQEIHQLCDRIEPMRKLADNRNLQPLLKIPFFAELAFRVLGTGAKFADSDGEMEFKAAVWQHVIAKEQERANGMPAKRKQVFVDIAVKRAKRMLFAIPEDDFDPAVITKLEEDNLIFRDANAGLVNPAHDVLEDWALENYIETAYKKHANDLADFLAQIGNEPAISRAFRLWLHNKLRNDADVNGLIYAILNNKNIQGYWQDETITAILQGDKPTVFLDALHQQLFADNAKLLIRFCFIQRIVCQIPVQNNTTTQAQNSEQIVYTLAMQPDGYGWQAMFSLLYINRKLIQEKLIPHVIELLSDWTNTLNINEPTPLATAEIGLLSLHLLNHFKNSSKDDDIKKKLFSIIFKTAPAIKKEFLTLLESDIFVDHKTANKHSQRLRYVNDFCETLLSNFEFTFLCKQCPELVIRLALFEWFIPKVYKNQNNGYQSDFKIAECFGLYEFKYEYFPASGAKGPFLSLLNTHPSKAIDFIIKLLNMAAKNYAHSNLDGRDFGAHRKIDYAAPQIEQITIQLNDGTYIEQFCTERLWHAYRGFSVVPYLLQCALMALENALIGYVEHAEPSDIEWWFDYILRNSNSVMTTAVLASVATGFPEKAGQSALPFLSIPQCYSLDMHRMLHERGENENNYFDINTQVHAEYYVRERKKAALRGWRKEHLETLIVRLQLTAQRDKAYKAIDNLRKFDPKTENIQFLLHRIDSRHWQAVKDKENARILFQPKCLEANLKEVQDQTQEEADSTNRIYRLYLWAKQSFENTPIEHDTYKDWHDALCQAKALLKEIKAGDGEQFAVMYHGSFVTAAAVFVRDFSNDLNATDVDWCVDFIITAIMKKAYASDNISNVDETDHDGAAAAASVVFILLDFATDKAEIYAIKRLIAVTLTHENRNVRQSAANGIRQHLWQRSPHFAQSCIHGAVEYARFEKDNRREKYEFFHAQNHCEAKSEKKIEEFSWFTKLEDFRDQLAQEKIVGCSPTIALNTHCAWHVLTPALMVPSGSIIPEHTKLLTLLLGVLYESEQNEEDYQNSEENLTIHHKLQWPFFELFARHLCCIRDSDYAVYIAPLRDGCKLAPNIIDSIMMQCAIIAEQEEHKIAYWQLWKSLAKKVRELYCASTQVKAYDRFEGNLTKLVNTMLHSYMTADAPEWEKQLLFFGKDDILDFVSAAGDKPTAFKCLSLLIYHFPAAFFDSGIHILANHRQNSKAGELLSNANTLFYLERTIQRFLQIENTGPIPRKLHETCLILLNGIVEKGSSRAYYLREQLIRSRRIA